MTGDADPTLTDAVHGSLELLRIAASTAASALAAEAARHREPAEPRVALLEALRSRRRPAGPEVVGRAGAIGCDLSAGAVALCAELELDRPRLALAIITDATRGAIAAELPVAETARRRLYALLPAARIGPRGCGEQAARLSERLERFGGAGYSSFHADPAGLGDAIREAELMTDLRRAAGSHGVQRGTYRLLVRLLAADPEQLTELCELTVAPMEAYDAHHGTDLVRTLDTYLNANCNMNLTAARIYAHRHTIASRLERIHELTGLDPTRFDDRELLGLGLKSQRLLGTPATDWRAPTRRAASGRA